MAALKIINAFELRSIPEIFSGGTNCEN